MKGAFMKKKLKVGFIMILLAYAIGVVLSFVSDDSLEIVEHLSSTTAAVAAGLGFVLFVLYMASGDKSKKDDFGTGRTKNSGKMQQYFDSRWITAQELLSDSKFMPTTYSKLPTVKKSGIVIRNLLSGGNLLVNMYNPIHTLVIGTTGSGKTTLLIEPAIRILSKTGEKPCLVITDPKGELYNNHSIQLQEAGYRIMVLDLRNPYASTRWNPMDNAYLMYHRAHNLYKEIKEHRGDSPKAYPKLKTFSSNYGQVWYEYNGVAYPDKTQLEVDIKSKQQELVDLAELELREIASTIVPVESKTDSSWERGAQDFLYGLMLAMLEDSLNPDLGMTRNRFNFYNLGKIANYRDPDPDNMFGTLRAFCDTGRGQFSKVQSLTSTVINNAPNTTRSYLGVLQSRISIFQDAGICYATSGSDMVFDDFTEKPTVLFIKVPDEKESRHSIATMCISQIYKKLIEVASYKPSLSLDKPVYFLLDEFANLPKVPKMDSIITVARSRKIFFELVVQSYSQLENKYGKEVAETIKGNCNIQIYLGTEDQKTKEEYSKMCGEISMETEDKSVSVSDKQGTDANRTTNKRVVNRPLIYPYELGQLPNGTAIVKIFQVNPIKTELTPWYKTPQFDKRKAVEVYVPSRYLDEQAVYYDIAVRNKKFMKNVSSPFDDFDF
jgi:type IV secretion system protein VirD4